VNAKLYFHILDKENYVTLLKELREGLDKIQSDTPKLITIAVSAIPSKITAGLSKDLGQYLDLINVMAYVSRASEVVHRDTITTDRYI
jgi:GH18 family chitinase